MFAPRPGHVRLLWTLSLSTLNAYWSAEWLTCVVWNGELLVSFQQHRESCLRLGLPTVDALVIHDLDIKHLGEETEQHLTKLTNRNGGGLKALLDLIRNP